MNTILYRLIIVLTGISAIGMIALQSVFLLKQYHRQQADFDLDVQRAVAGAAGIYTQWNSHTSTTEDAATYNALYANEDSTFIFLIAQSAQQYPLLDFRPDERLPPLRREQFLRFRDELERTRLRDNPRLREFYVFRTIQYCAGCDEGLESITQVFPLDSLIRGQLAVHRIQTATDVAFYHRGQGRYTYLSPGADTAALNRSPYAFDFTPGEQLRLHFPDRSRLLIRSLLIPLAASLGLIVVSLSSFWLALRVIFRQKQLSDLKTDFINNVTHEFKTPISTIAFAVANIENEQTISRPEYIRQFTRVIRDENRRLNAQVERVLQAAITDREGLELRREPVNLHQLINELADAYELTIGSHGVLHRKLNAARAEVMGDAFHLSNALSNLLDNAQKYSGEVIDITISTENTGQGIVIRVADQGVGISREHQAQIFDRFFRVPHGNLHNVKGFGLGLSYVREVAVRHRGAVRVSSKVGEGSTFSLFLPYE